MHRWMKQRSHCIWHHYFVAGGPIWTKFARLMQNSTQLTVIGSKSKRECTFVYDVRLMTSRELYSYSTILWWSSGYLRMAVKHLPTKFSANTFMQSGEINISGNKIWGSICHLVFHGNWLSSTHVTPILKTSVSLRSTNALNVNFLLPTRFLQPVNLAIFTNWSPFNPLAVPAPHLLLPILAYHNHLLIDKNLAIANRSPVSCAHNTLMASISINITPWPWNLG